MPLTPSYDHILIVNSHDEEVAWTNNANWLSAGPWLTSREAYLQWVYQGAAAKFAFFMKQIPAHLNPQIDLDAMRKCISVKDENGHRIYPKTWRHRPESNTFFKTRAQSERKWQAHITKQSAFLPALGGGLSIPQHPLYVINNCGCFSITFETFEA